MSGKRKSLILEEKVNIIKCIENNVKKSDAAKKIGIPSSNLSTILQNREKNLKIVIKGAVSLIF